MMWLTFPFEVETETHNFLFEAECFGIQGHPSKISGPPEYCDPGEPDWIEDFTFTLKKVSPPEGQFTKVELGEAEFQWWFGERAIVKAYDLGYKALGDYGRAEL